MYTHPDPASMACSQVEVAELLIDLGAPVDMKSLERLKAPIGAGMPVK